MYNCTFYLNVLFIIIIICVPHSQKDEVYLNLVLDYVPETVYRVARHYSRAKQTLPMVYVKVCDVSIPRQKRHSVEVHNLVRMATSI